MMEPEPRRFSGTGLLLPLALVGLLVLIILLLVTQCGGGGGDSASGGTATATPGPEATPDTSQPDAVVAQYVTSTLNREYAGACAEANPAQDVNKVCSTLLAERSGVHGYVLGQTFSEGTEWVFVEERGGQWIVIASKPITPESREVPGVPWPLRVGAEVVIIGTAPQNCLNVRTEPGGQSVDCIAEGTRITLSAGPQQANDREWWRVEGRDGWVAADYLRFPDATTDPVPPANQAPASTPTPGP